MEEQAIEQLARRIADLHTETLAIDREAHRAHHEWIQSRLAYEQRCQARREQIANSIIGSVVLSVLAALAAFGAWAVQQWVRNQ